MACQPQEGQSGSRAGAEVPRTLQPDVSLKYLGAAAAGGPAHSLLAGAAMMPQYHAVPHSTRQYPAVPTLRSRWLVGSSSSNRLGWRKSACARLTRMRHPPAAGRAYIQCADEARRVASGPAAPEHSASSTPAAPERSAASTQRGQHAARPAHSATRREQETRWLHHPPESWPMGPSISLGAKPNPSRMLRACSSVPGQCRSECSPRAAQGRE